MKMAGKGRQSGRGFLERSIADISAALEKTIFAEELARQAGLLQDLDPRVKIVTFLALLLAVSLSQKLTVILALYGLALLLAWLSRVPLGFFIKRVWLFIPFFTGLVALPALFNILTPGEPVVVIWGSPFVAITRQGVQTATFLILRVGTSVSFAVLLVLTTSWNTLLKALSILRVPQVFILVLGMTHRYIYLLLHTTNDMFLARKSRVVGQLSMAEHRRWVAASIGTLLGKSYHLSNEVYLAMLSRGFLGEVHLLENFRMRPRDWALGGAMLFIALGAVLLR